MLKDLRTYLLTYDDISDALATYEDLPALFTVDPIPAESDHPAGILTMVGGTDDLHTGDQHGGEVLVDLRLYDDKTNTTQRIRELAWDCYKVLTRQDFPSTDYDIQLVECGPPYQLDDPDGFPGFRLTMQVTFLLV